MRKSWTSNKFEIFEILTTQQEFYKASFSLTSSFLISHFTQVIKIEKFLHTMSLVNTGEL